MQQRNSHVISHAHSTRYDLHHRAHDDADDDRYALRCRDDRQQRRRTIPRCYVVGSEEDRKALRLLQRCRVYKFACKRRKKQTRDYERVNQEELL